ncbi:hypothetical protein A2154_00170 [Candidatus Gottesmanbacteria bacterium RBG_16_43_7]|uniref:Glycosyltransferase 2-like domain-containing protein n=1 Tax=Candidatus Gottesmanbacteria bacterium RBG_16_43_7 TaxID=1798373 RepID=A0A1F5ZDC2_9BACT|nr:MAG: hypothetical protein A2154_00170 [Candidatus Gottesmanbacteria bacterium RBG_16_43_7]
MISRFGLSIIIVSFNTSKLLYNCLESVYTHLIKAKFPFEVIMVDNASSDDSVSMVKKNFPRVKLIINSQNIGFGKANNQGYTAARGEYILFLNSDVVALEKSIERLYGFIRRHPKAIVGAKLINTDGTPQPSCGPFYSLPVICIMLFFKGDKFGLTRRSPDKTIKTDWVSGACFISHRDLLGDGLLFDESIFMYMEEIDLMYRAKKSGYKTIFYPNARFIHIGAASSKSNAMPVVNIFRGLTYFYQKHHTRTANDILKGMLFVKSLIAIILGVLTLNEKLRSTYAKAIRTL